MKASIDRLGAGAVALVLCAAIFVQPHVVERWGLYLGSAALPQRARLFLDPFPSDATCETRVRVFAANNERAFCASHRTLEFGTAADAVLAADFDPLFPASWRCGPPHYPNVGMIFRDRRAIVAR